MTTDDPVATIKDVTAQQAADTSPGADKAQTTADTKKPKSKHLIAESPLPDAPAKAKKLVATKPVISAEAAAAAAIKSAPKPAPAARPNTQPPVATAASPKRRHWVILFSLIAWVLLPLLVAGWYLWGRAADQYASFVSFSVRAGDTRSDSSGLLGRLSQFSGPNSIDTDILYQFIQSQELVERLDQRLGLRALYSRHYNRDPIFSFNPEGKTEDLVLYWQRMVEISYDAGTGLMGLRVLAFDPAEALRIATAISEESTLRINQLSESARADSTRYAREELDKALARLRDARAAVTDFRSRNQLVDPSADIQGQLGLLNNLQAELAEALIDLDLLNETARPGDPRIAQLDLRIRFIRERIAEERSRFGVGADGAAGDTYATLVSEFERLNVDREFAEEVYRAALLSYNGALSDAERTSRYLAEHIKPTLADSSRYPERHILIAALALILLLIWSVSVLIYYSIRDRR